MKKLTIDTAINHEAMHIADALASGCIELNDECLERYFSKECAEILMKLECRKEREMVIDSHLADDNWRGIVGYDEGSHINLPIGEIEIQFEGKADDYFEEPSEWYIQGDLAYVAIGGICWTLDLEELKRDVNDWLAHKLEDQWQQEQRDEKTMTEMNRVFDRIESLLERGSK